MERVKFTNEELKFAIGACVENSMAGDTCIEYPYGPIGDWDVSNVTDMS